MILEAALQASLGLKRIATDRQIADLAGSAVLAAKEPAALATLGILLPQLHIGALRAPDPALYANLPLPEKDKPVLAAAIHHRCAVVITGDRTHFGPLCGKTISSVTVHSPRSAAVMLLPAAARKA